MCIMGYLLVISGLNSASMVNFGTVLVSQVIQLFVMCGSAAYLNKCACEFIDALYKKVWFSGKSLVNKQGTILFMINTLHNPVVLTYFGLFTLNKEALLSIFGTMIAYFIVVIQFAQESSVDITITGSNGNLPATTGNSSVLNTTLSNFSN